MIDMRNKTSVSQKLPWGGYLSNHTLYFSYCFYNQFVLKDFKSCFHGGSNFFAMCK